MISLTLDQIVFPVQIISFILLCVALKRLVFDPVGAVLDERKKRTEGVRGEASHLREAAQVSSAEYDRRMQEVRRSIARENDSERAQTSEAERRVVAAAQDEASQRLATEREATQRQAAQAREALDGRSRELATLILEQVGGRKFA